MTINIGLMIWKEMKIKSISRDDFATRLNIKRAKLDRVIHSVSIDIELLVKISSILEINLFEYFSNDEDIGKFSHCMTGKKLDVMDELSLLKQQRKGLLEQIRYILIQHAKMTKILENIT